MAHFYERINKKSIKYDEELTKLYSLLNQTRESFSMSESFAELIDSNCFKKIKLCGNYLSFQSMLSDAYEIRNKREQFICLSEIILSLDKQMDSSMVNGISNREFAKQQLSGMKNLVLYDLKKLNLSVEMVEDNLGIVASIGPKNALLEDVLNCIDDKNVETMLIKYNASSNDGKVDEKENILCAIYSYVESYLKDPQLLNSNKRLFENVDFLYNNLNMKHDNKVFNETFFYQETLINREKWLDDLYHLVLMVIASKQECEINQSINDLKAKKKKIK